MSGASTAVASASRRTAELLAALSTGLDAAERRTVGHAVRTAFIALRMAAELDLAEATRSELLYAGLLRDAGSTGLSAEDAEEDASAQVEADRPFLSRRMGRLRGNRRVAREAHLSPPDRAAAVVHAMGLPNGVADAVFSVDERWDGRGPAHLKRDAIPHAARLVAVASAAAEAWAAGPAATRRPRPSSTTRQPTSRSCARFAPSEDAALTRCWLTCVSASANGGSGAISRPRT